MRSVLTRLGVATVATSMALAMTVGPATAAPDEGPYVFDAAGAGQAVSIVVGLPQAVADGLEPVLVELPGIELIGNELQINLANVLGELELPLAGDVPGDVLSNVSATSLSGSLAGLVETLLGGAGTCLDTPVDITVPPGADVPLLSLQLLQAECVEDASGRVSIASSKIADLEVNLAGAIAILPAEVTEPLTDAVDTVTDTVTDSVLGPLIDSVVTPATDAINDAIGTDVDLSEAVRIPELIDLPLVSIDLIESRTEQLTAGDRITSVTTSTLAGVSLLGTVCLPDTTYRAEAFSTGVPGGNDYATSIPPIDVAICETDSLSPILRLLDVEGVVGDVLVNLGGGELQSLEELLAGTGLPVGEVLDGLDELLATIGVSTVVQGSQTDAHRADDGSSAGVAVSPFRVTVAPLANFVGGTPLEGLKVELRGLAAAANAAAAPAPVEPQAPPAPVAPEAPPAPEPPPAMPRTGGGALLAGLGILGMAGALNMRRRMH